MMIMLINVVLLFMVLYSSNYFINLVVQLLFCYLIFF